MEIITNSELKTSFIGISLGNLSTIESAVAVIDSNLKIITLDKLFTINDIKFFIDNFPGIKSAIITVSIPDNEVMISNKWKYNSRTYDTVNLNTKMMNRDDWTRRYSTRGCEYFRELKSKGVDIFRFDINNMKDSLGSSNAFLKRSPTDCKALQDLLRIKYGMKELPANMLPVAQLEAILGAFLSRNLALNLLPCKFLGEYEKLSIIGI